METVVQREEDIKSRPVWGAWIEILRLTYFVGRILLSRPVWGAWIEIGESGNAAASGWVAPRMGRVD